MRIKIDFFLVLILLFSVYMVWHLGRAYEYQRAQASAKTEIGQVREWADYQLSRCYANLEDLENSTPTATLTPYIQEN